LLGINLGLRAKTGRTPKELFAKGGFMHIFRGEGVLEDPSQRNVPPRGPGSLEKLAQDAKHVCTTVYMPDSNV